MDEVSADEIKALGLAARLQNVYETSTDPVISPCPMVLLKETIDYLNDIGTYGFGVPRPKKKRPVVVPLKPPELADD